jgi:5-(aminomethyl)-3-furanmethanol phosphate kinase
LPQDWSVTSDGLAAWLACRIAHSEVALIKSCAVPKGASPEHLVAAGIADPTFARIVRDHALPWRVICASDTEQLTELLTGRS